METRRDIFQAIADPTRRTIIGLLACQSMTPGDIASNFDTARQTISRHIRILAECRLVRQEQNGREIVYHLNPTRMKEVADWIGQYQRLWDKKLDALERYLSKIQKNKK